MSWEARATVGTAGAAGSRNSALDPRRGGAVALWTERVGRRRGHRRKSTP